jgi:DNA-binding LacI/PurR family transcriptional regulator
VAEQAGVAISTVSRVLNNGRASEDVRARVQKAARELGYAPSVAAQSLVTRRTGCIGLAVNATKGPWFSEVLAGMEEALAPSRRSVLLASMMLTGRYDPSAVSAWIEEHRVDGLMFVRFSRRDRPLFNAATRAALPVVLFVPDIHAPADLIVRCNNVEAGWLAAQHLAGLGHQRVAFAGGPQQSQDTRDRLRGLADGLADCGIEGRCCDVWFGPDYYPDAGIEYAERFLQAPERSRATAVVLGSDAMAFGFLRSMLRHSVPVPNEVSVMGFDGVPEGELVWPGLTTVAQPTRRMAASACRALLDCIENPDRDQVAVVEHGVELLVRESTAPPPRE